MDKNAAKRIIQETLQNSFDKTRFRNFVVNLLNHVDENKAFHARGHVKEMFKQQAGVIKTYERIGTYTDPEGKKLDILIVYLEKTGTIDKARTTLRNFAAYYLKQRDEKDAGLFAFVSPNLDDWRFSYVKMEYNLQEIKGKVRAKEEFTPAKRYSFLVGKNESSHTAQNQFVPLLEEDGHNPTLAEIEDKFNIEVITKEFFIKYRELFLDVKDALEKVVERDEKIKEEFSAKFLDTTDFAKKLLGQIVFLYFLQKKGWFGVERDLEWGTGPKNFLRLLYQKQYCDYKNFFNDVLEPLFYNALAIERPHDWSDRFNCKIPFLNGGLFDPIRNYDWVHTDIELPNNLFHNDIKTKEGDTGTGILDIFDRYNFTVKEDEPLEKEVAVDPEMLGKVFENLLEVKDRKSKGTYYTPREIVHYMCEQSLINYLVAELEGKVLKEDLEQLIRFGEDVAENEATYIAKKEDDPDYVGLYKQILPPSIGEYATEIDSKLATIKVCDPAIGSGAFPVGMMSEIVKARGVLSNYIKDRERTVYGFKRDCIQNSLYGVDIDPGAVEIAKLRLWLSLIVDEEDIKDIKPLPNLDYKIMQGNSLLEEYEGIKLFDEKLLALTTATDEHALEKLKEKQSVFSKKILPFYSQNPAWKNNPKLERPLELFQIEKEFKQVQQQIKNHLSTSTIRSNGEFLQRGLNFGQQANIGQLGDELKLLHRQFFEESSKNKKDEIKKRIGNLEWELIEATLKDQGKISELKKLEDFKKSNTRPFFLWKLHFAEVFQEKGGFDITLANPPYGANIDDLVNSYKKIYPEVIKNYADIYKIFFELGLKILKKSGTETFITPNTYLAQPRYKDLRSYLIKYKIKQIINLGEGVFEGVVVPVCVSIIEKNDSVNNYLFGDASINGKYAKNISHLEFNSVSLAQVLETPDMSLLQKFTLKDDEVFFGTAFEVKDAGIQYHRSGIGLKNKGGNDLYERIFNSDPEKFQKTVPIWYGKLIDRYSIKEKTDEYFDLNYKKSLKEKESVSFSHEAFEIKEKILWRQTAPYPIATIDFQGRWFRNTIQCAWLKNGYKNKLDLRYILALLNSTYIKYLYKQIVNESAGRAFPQVKITYLKKLPIRLASLNDQKNVSNLVEQLFELKKELGFDSNNTAKQAKVRDFEHQIDKLVYKLYDVTDEEIKIIEAN